MGKSRGGLSTKIHAAVDALGRPVRFIITAGQHSEIKQANSLIEGFSADYVIADKRPLSKPSHPTQNYGYLQSS